MSREVETENDTMSSGNCTITIVSANVPKGLCEGTVFVKLIYEVEHLQEKVLEDNLQETEEKHEVKDIPNVCDDIREDVTVGNVTVGKEVELSVYKFKENFKRGQRNSFEVYEPEYVTMHDRKVVGIEIRGGSMVGKYGWNIDKVEVNSVKVVFSVFTNIICGKTYRFMRDDISLPQNCKKAKERVSDLAEKRKLYTLTTDRLHVPGCPPLIKDLPPAEDFSFLYKARIAFKLKRKQMKATIDEFFDGEFKEMKDIEGVFGYSFPSPLTLNRWNDDVLFGMQRLTSVNPVMIRLCTNIPDKVKVHSQMLEEFLESKTLDDTLQSNRIFIIDYEILRRIPTKEGFFMTAPIALFYQRDDGKLVPIAIQLFQEPGENNPVFLPNDPENMWILAKMWFNVADSNYHQSVTHLGFTHLKMEGIAVATQRQIHKDHPIFQLLMPHFLYLLAINYVGIPQLIGENGYVSKLLNLGSEGMKELIKRKNQTWRMDTDGTLPADINDRGVDNSDDPNLLPDYYYRDDAKKLYDAILNYVTNYLDIYYKLDTDVQEDNELQQWRKQIVDPVDEQGLGMLGVFGENDEFTNKEQVGSTLTSIIFTCSVQHAAVNFRQYEDYAFPPNFPLCLRGEPPTTKDNPEEINLIQHLPQKKTTYDTLVITNVLSTNRVHALGNFEVEYIHDKDALDALQQFRIRLAKISEQIRTRNDKKTDNEKYNCLNPTKVPNSISI